MHPGCPSTLSLLQTWAFQEKGGVMQWHSTPDSDWKQDTDASEDTQQHSCSMRRELQHKHSPLIWSSWAFMTLPPQADPLVHPWNTSTAGRVWKIFSTPWPWLVKHVPRWCRLLRVTAMEECGGSWQRRCSALKPPRRTVDIWNIKAPNSTSVRCLKVTRLETGLVLGSVGWRL